MLNNYRPWGQIDWLLNHSSIDNITFIGCLSTEHRCTESAKIMSDKLGKSVQYHFSLIHDPIHDDEQLTKSKIEHSRSIIEEELCLDVSFEEFDLLGPPLDFCDYLDEILETAESIVLDITCFPKRFFFMAIKQILAANVKNLLVTYTKPDSYCKSGVLSGDPDTLEALPFFNSQEVSKEDSVLLLGIGHSELGLVGALEKKAPKLNLQVLFPFPPGPPSIEKNWRFMHSIQELRFANGSVDPIRVSASNVSDTFDHLMNLTDDGKEPAIIAPYGPKPMSLAMCLFALKTDSEVVYTQPKSYSASYSDGVAKTESGDSAVYGYWICVDGDNLFF